VFNSSINFKTDTYGFVIYGQSSESAKKTTTGSAGCGNTELVFSYGVETKSSQESIFLVESEAEQGCCVAQLPSPKWSKQWISPNSTSRKVVGCDLVESHLPSLQPFTPEL
jgi:hypothetical protein